MSDKNVVVSSRWRHKKRGTEYTFLSVVKMQCSANRNFDDVELVLYQGDDGQLWTRLKYEFFDGRFEAI